MAMLIGCAKGSIGVHPKATESDKDWSVEVSLLVALAPPHSDDVTWRKKQF